MSLTTEAPRGILSATRPAYRQMRDLVRWAIKRNLDYSGGPDHALVRKGSKWFVCLFYKRSGKAFIGYVDTGSLNLPDVQDEVDALVAHDIEEAWEIVRQATERLFVPVTDE